MAKRDSRFAGKTHHSERDEKTGLYDSHGRQEANEMRSSRRRRANVGQAGWVPLVESGLQSTEETISASKTSTQQ